MAENHLRKYSTFLVISEIQIRTTLRFHLTPVRMAIIKSQVTVDAGKDMDKEEHFSTAGDTVNWYNHTGNQLGISSEIWT